MFQSTHPCGVRRTYRFTRCQTIGFNPRTRVGCDCKSTSHPCGYPVSIHAPVWGATIAWMPTVLTGVFQSTHPCGVRLPLRLKVFQVLVSIHAPVWGATSFSSSLSGSSKVSIHAPVWGATDSLICRVIHALFQSTHPCGVRQANDYRP